jgi:hypothetical protein
MSEIDSTNISSSYVHNVTPVVFRAHFGLDATQVLDLLRIVNVVVRKQVHLLVALFFLRFYQADLICASMFHVDAKTYRKHAFGVVKQLDLLLPDVMYLISIIGLRSEPGGRCLNWMRLRRQSANQQASC